MPATAKRTWPAAVVGGALVALMVAGPALSKTRTFRTPSGNIACLYSSSAGPGPYLRCDVLSLNDVAYRLRATGRGRRIHVTDTVSAPGSRVLRYGTVRNYGPFRCRSRRRGLTCVARPSGHGFRLSREHQRGF